MRTYQDLIEIEEKGENLLDFVHSTIQQHRGSNIFRTAQTADRYYRQQNETILQFQKLLYTLEGKAVPDTFSANYKLCSNFLHRFITQEALYLLGNGVQFGEDGTADRLGSDFDQRMVEIAVDALKDGVAFGFFNLDHVEVFSLVEFCPLYDEENGALRAGIRFWQVDQTKPLRATLYEEDGYTDYMWENGKGSILADKRPYKLLTRSTPVDGTEIYDGENYPGFPIVPLWGNPERQSEIIGIRENIDAYDLIKSGFANTIDDASEIYWIVQNAGGMDDVDLAQFMDRLRRTHAAMVDEDGATAESHTLDIPYAAREAILQRLRNDLYDDYMALDVKQIAGGATTATQIQAAYEPINAKVDQFEMCVTDFIQGIFDVAGIADEPTYTRSKIVNTSEEVQTILSAAQYLPSDYVTEKILTMFGDAGRVEEVLAMMDEEEMDKFGNVPEEPVPAEPDGEADGDDGQEDLEE